MENILRRHTDGRRLAARGASLTAGPRPAAVRVLFTGGPANRSPIRRPVPGPRDFPPASGHHRHSNENRSCWISVHRGRARAGGGAGRDAPVCAGRTFRRCSADSWPVSSAIPSGRFRRTPGLVVSPADGRVMIAGPSDGRWAPPGDVEADHDLSVADGRPHQPDAGGRPRHPRRLRPGKFLPAYNEGSNDNELNEVWIDYNGRHGRVPAGGRHAGAPDRVPRPRRADARTRQRVGLMKFGSRMDVFLPIDATLRVSVGDASSAAKRCSPRSGAPVLDNPPLLRRRREDRPNRFRRGVFLLPSLFTVANLFCGYACVVYSTRSDFDTAALLHRHRDGARHARRLLRPPDELVVGVRRRARFAGRRRLVRPRRRRFWRSRGDCGRSNGSDGRQAFST